MRSGTCPQLPRREPSSGTQSSGGNQGGPSGSSEEDELPTFSLTQARKRPREDFTDFAKQASRNVRLKPANEKAVIKFSKLSSPAQRITVYAALQAVSSQLEGVVTPDAMYEIPAKLEARIERYTCAVMVSPTCSSYKSGPVALIMEHLERNPQWGLTAAVKNEKSHLDIIQRKVQTTLTYRRNQIKSLLKNSIGDTSKDDESAEEPEVDGTDEEDNRDPKAKKKAGTWDIMRLSNAILALGNSVFPSQASSSIPSLARFAFLRACLVDSKDKKKNPLLAKDFWAGVDVKLQSVRKQKKTEDRISRFFAISLDADIESFGTIDKTEVNRDDDFEALGED